MTVLHIPYCTVCQRLWNPYFKLYSTLQRLVGTILWFLFTCVFLIAFCFDPAYLWQENIHSNGDWKKIIYSKRSTLFDDVLFYNSNSLPPPSGPHGKSKITSSPSYLLVILISVWKHKDKYNNCILSLFYCSIGYHMDKTNPKKGLNFVRPCSFGGYRTMIDSGQFV